MPVVMHLNYSGNPRPPGYSPEEGESAGLDPRQHLDMHFLHLLCLTKA